MIKLTKKRKLIFNTLEKSDKPLNAHLIFELIKDDNLNLSTVYRALDYLYSKGLIHRTNLDNIAFYYIPKREHHHYMICENCHQKISIDCKLKSIIKEVSLKYNFKIISHDLNFYGLCQNCQKELEIK